MFVIGLCNIFTIRLTDRLILGKLNYLLSIYMLVVHFPCFLKVSVALNFIDHFYVQVSSRGQLIATLVPELV